MWDDGYRKLLYDETEGGSMHGLRRPVTRQPGYKLPRMDNEYAMLYDAGYNTAARQTYTHDAHLHLPADYEARFNRAVEMIGRWPNPSEQNRVTCREVFDRGYRAGIYDRNAREGEVAEEANCETEGS